MTRQTRAVGVLVLCTLGLCGVACKDKPTPFVPDPSSATPPPPAPVLTRVTVTGITALSAVGDTTQLTATASYSDNTTRDVTTQSQWTASDPGVLAVAPNGLATVVGLGRTFVTANFMSRSGSLTVTATPPGTFAIFGRAREAGQGGLSNVTVQDLETGRAATTRADGLFTIAALPTASRRLSFAKEGYEPQMADLAQTEGFSDVPLQRTIRVTAGDSADPPPLAPNDMTYDVGGVRCHPCRMIRIVLPKGGDLGIRLTWSGAAPLRLLALDQTFAGQGGTLFGIVTVETPQEIRVYFGATAPNQIVNHTTFKVETTLP